MVRDGGFEPPRPFRTLGPKPSASASFASPACIIILSPIEHCVKRSRSDPSSVDRSGENGCDRAGAAGFEPASSSFGDRRFAFVKLHSHGSRGGIRTPDQVVNGHPLCQLSYPGMEPMTGIEPALSAWKADTLPLSYIGMSSGGGDRTLDLTIMRRAL